MSYLIATVIVYFAMTLFGHVSHWCIHKSWAGKLYKMHLKHHTLYVPNDFESETYRDPGSDNSAHIFVLAALPLIILPVVLAYAGVITWVMCCFVLAEMILVGLWNDWIHNAFHITNHWANKYYPGFSYLKAMHYVHHKNAQKNMGIFTLMWDHVFRTHKPAQEK